MGKIKLEDLVKDIPGGHNGLLKRKTIDSPLVFQRPIKKKKRILIQTPVIQTPTRPTLSRFNPAAGISISNSSSTIDELGKKDQVEGQEEVPENRPTIDLSLPPIGIWPPEGTPKVKQENEEEEDLVEEDEPLPTAILDTQPSTVEVA